MIVRQAQRHPAAALIVAGGLILVLGPATRGGAGAWLLEKLVRLGFRLLDGDELLLGIG